MHRSPRTRTTRSIALVATLVVATSLVACQNGKVGGKCKAGTVAQDATHVLVCRNGKWSRLISKADGMRELARIQAEEAAKNQPATTQPPATTAPTTTAPVTEPPATAPPTTAPVVTVPPTTAAPTTTTSTTTPPATTTSTPAPTTTSTTPATTTVPPTTAGPTTTVPATTSTTTAVVPPTTTSTTTTTPGSVTGDVDPSFGSGGRFVPAMPEEGQGVVGAAATTGGTTYLLSQSGTTSAIGPLQLRRVNASGDEDTSFGNSGVVDVSTLMCDGCSVSVDEQGRVYVVTRRIVGNPNVTAIQRYSADGDVDTSYGTNGQAVAPADFTTVSGVGADGSAIAINQFSHTITRFSPTGATTTTPLPAGICSPGRIVVDRSGRAVVTLAPCDSDQTRTDIARLLPNGTLDTSWNGTGIVSIPDLPPALAASIALDSLDRVYVVQGTTARRLANGALDPTFSGDGVADLPTVGSSPVVGAITVANDSLFATIGEGSPSSRTYSIAKLTPSGTVDGSFGVNGVASPAIFATIPSAPFSTMYPSAARLVPSGSGVVIVSTAPFQDSRLGTLLGDGFVKLDGSGNTLPSYGANGVLILHHDRVNLVLTEALAGPNGSVQLVLNAPNGGGLAFVRITAQGTIDTSFSGDGWFTDAGAVSAVTDPQGRLLVFRTVGPTGTTSFGNTAAPLSRSVLRLTTSGVPDTSFHTGDGAVAWPDLAVGTASYTSCAGRLVAMPDGSAIVTYEGSGRVPLCSTTGFDRVLASGQLVQNWGSGFPAATSGGYPTLAVPSPGGKLVVKAADASTNPLTLKLVRLNANGSLDTTFGTGGSFAPVTSGGSTMGQISVLADESIVTSSTTAASVSFPDSSAWVRRYLPSGQVVTGGGFGAGGVVILQHVLHLTFTSTKIVGAGWDARGVVSVFGANATPDTTFPAAGGTGRAGFGQTGPAQNAFPVVTSDGRVVVVSFIGDQPLEIHKVTGTIG